MKPRFWWSCTIPSVLRSHWSSSCCPLPPPHHCLAEKQQLLEVPASVPQAWTVLLSHSPTGLVQGPPLPSVLGLLPAEPARCTAFHMPHTTVSFMASCCLCDCVLALMALLFLGPALFLDKVVQIIQCALLFSEALFPF